MARKHRRAGKPPKDLLRKKFLSDVLRRNPRVIKVLQAHGVHFCAGCFLTLTSPLEKVAAYHAVPDHAAFLRDMRRVLAGRKR